MVVFSPHGRNWDISARNPTKQGARVWDETTHGVLQSFPREALQNSLRASFAQNRDAMQGGFRSRYRDISARNSTKQGARVWDETTHGVLQSFLKY
jgi:hypothetical protein